MAVALVGNALHGVSPRIIQSLRISRSLSGFRSAYSLDKIYPESNISSPAAVQVKVPECQSDSFSGYIPMKELDIAYSRSSGPGGQNVNKLNTKVDVRFHVQSAAWLPDTAKEGLLTKYRSRITRDGYLCVRSERTRSQQLNLADALDRIRHLVTEVTNTPRTASPETVERHRRLHEKANRERLREKRLRSSHWQQKRIDL